METKREDEVKTAEGGNHLVEEQMAHEGQGNSVGDENGPLEQKHQVDAKQADVEQVNEHTNVQLADDLVVPKQEASKLDESVRE